MEFVVRFMNVLLMGQGERVEPPVRGFLVYNSESAQLCKTKETFLGPCSTPSSKIISL